MKTCAHCGEQKAVSEFNLDKQSSDGLRSWCRACAKSASKKYYRENKEKVDRQAKEWRERHPAYYRERRKNGRTVDASVKRRMAAYRARHPELQALSASARRAISVKATPGWANQFFMQEAYRLANLRGRVTGFKWSVDHVIPLRHPLVCGLHTEQNLAVIPAMLNNAKNNSFAV